MTIKLPIKPIITAVHLLIPTFSFKKIGDKAVVTSGATKANVKALAIEIIEIEQKKQIFADNKVIPLKICNFGFPDNVKFFLKKKNINGNVQTTVKKYLAHVIWKNDISEERYFAIVSMKGRTAQADKFKMIAFIKENILMQKIHRQVR